MNGFQVQVRPSRTGTSRHYYARRIGGFPWVRITAPQYQRLIAAGAKHVE